VGGFQSELANGSIISKNLPQSGSLGFINIDDQPGNMNGMLICFLSDWYVKGYYFSYIEIDLG